MIHLSEVASLSTEQIEAMQKPKGPSIFAEGFPISIPAMPKKKSGNGAFPHKMACPRCEKTESIRPWGMWSPKSSKPTVAESRPNRT